MVHLHIDLTNEGLEKNLGGHLIGVGEVGLTAEIRVDVLSRTKLTRDLNPVIKVKFLTIPVHSSNNGESERPNNDDGESQQDLKKKNEELKNKLEESEKKIRDLRRDNTKLNETNADLTRRLMEVKIEVPPK